MFRKCVASVVASNSSSVRVLQQSGARLVVSAQVPRRAYPALSTYKNRITTVENVEKITSSMKMVATSKLRQAQRRLEPAMSWFDSVDRAFAELDEPKYDASTGAASAAGTVAADGSIASGNPKHLVVMLNTDRGLCGAITSNVVRSCEAMRKEIAAKGTEVEFASVGSKGQDALVASKKSKSLGIVALELGAKPPTFTEICYLAEKLMERNADSVTVVYTKFINLLKNEVSSRHFHTVPQLAAQSKWEATEFDDQDVFNDLAEFQFASALWGYLHENQTCEQAVRMTAMDGASTNAAELVGELTLEYNKARQAAITTELGEIVSGMAAILDA